MAFADAWSLEEDEHVESSSSRLIIWKSLRHSLLTKTGS